MTNNTKNLPIFGLLVLVGLLLINSCEEKEVPFINDDKELRSYVNESELGRQLFRKNNLVTSTPFTLAASPGSVYRIFVDSVVRTIETDITEQGTGKWFRNDVLPDPSGDGWRDAEVVVSDRVYLRTLRVSGVDSITTTASPVLTRVGWFVKYGDDGNDYAGWLLFGFNGSSPFDNMGLLAMFEVTAPNAYTVRGDTNVVDTLSMAHYPFARQPNIIDTMHFPERTKYRYRKITDTTSVLKLQQGEVKLALNFGSVPDGSNYVLLTSEQASGLETVLMDRVGNYYQDTLLVPDSLSGWYLMVLQEVRNTTARRIWCVPYRVWRP